MFPAGGISSISRFSVKSSGHSGRPSLLFPEASTRHFPGASSLLREFAGFNEVNESCGGDIEEELVQKEEPLGNASSAISPAKESNTMLPREDVDGRKRHACRDRT